MTASKEIKLGGDKTANQNQRGCNGVKDRQWQRTGRKDKEAEERRRESQRERFEGGWGDSLGLLQRRRRWTACDDWRLSVEKINKRHKEKERWHVGEMKCVQNVMTACRWRRQMWNHY